MVKRATSQSASSSSSSSSLIASTAALRKALSRYDEALEARAKSYARCAELVELDGWYRKDLWLVIRRRDQAVQESGSISERHLQLEELCKVMKWKLTRGSFRPKLLSLVESNSSDVVRETTLRAWREVQTSPDEAIKALSELKGVGPATATAILCALTLGQYAFMSDAAMERACGMKPEYTAKAAKHFRIKMQERMDKDEPRWKSLDELERAAWAFHTLSRLDGDAPTNQLPPQTKRKAASPLAQTEGRSPRRKKV
ncbi:hypothetical protein IE81DRAFT_49231 [Ceraceosorus guamensis]|uniref:Uncharacterized protein n=1 Tax=Ceraceosorus guamensis TaxID=1522189 RepID=A0A316VSG8_9BASI|nr:hypothetical protein IE81DRAFT_49231 [Ceraceosorus guamensis]PWN39131.1 hypothetical protein IE81DRAFT_49231 [Ceraceosorus guamensis]